MGLLTYMDVNIMMKGCEGIPRMDVVGHADPYIILVVTTPDGKRQVKYKTDVQYNTANPCWDEEVTLENVPPGTTCVFQIFDKDHLTRHDEVGTCELRLQPDAAMMGKGSTSSANASLSSREPTAAYHCSNGSSRVPKRVDTATRAAAAAAGADLQRLSLSSNSDSEPPSGAEDVVGLRLPIRTAPSVPSPAGVLLLTVRCRPSSKPPGPMVHAGPVRFRVSISTLAGVLTGHNDADCWRAYAAYKLKLVGLRQFFPEGAAQHWNQQYDKARTIFSSLAAVSAVRTQHAVLYADSGQAKCRGGLRGGGDLLKLLRGGVRAGQRRYYTYCIAEDGSMCFSETGAAFFSDFMSKHAMHAGCAEKVVYAGEFCLLPPGLPSSAPSASPAHPTSAPIAHMTTAEAATDAATATALLAGVQGAAAGGWRLVIDNNSGTYAPTKELLPALKGLMEHNFPGLQVEAIDAREDPRLAAYHARIPSRVKP